MSAAERTTANAAQKALETRLQAREDLAAAIVQIGLPAEEPTEDDRIYLTAVDDLTRAQHPAGLAAGPKIFQESYTLTVLVETRHSGSRDEPQLRGETNDRMWAIIAEIEQELADDHELADDVDQAYVQGIPIAFTVPAPEGWIGKAVAHIHVDALCILG